MTANYNEVFTESTLPIDHKFILTIKEASEYSNIGINRLSRILDDPYCEFALFNGNRKLVKRKAFEKYLSEAHNIDI